MPSPKERLLDLSVLVARNAVVEGSIRKEEARNVRVGPGEPGAGGNHRDGSRGRDGVAAVVVVVGPEAAVRAIAAEAVFVGREAAVLVVSQPNAVHELQEEPSLHATELEGRRLARCGGKGTGRGAAVKEVWRSLIVHARGRL